MRMKKIMKAVLMVFAACLASTMFLTACEGFSLGNLGGIFSDNDSEITSENASESGGNTEESANGNGDGESGDNSGNGSSNGGNATEEHSHTYITVTVDATCTETGLTTYTCDCGDTYSETIPMLSHDYRAETFVVGGETYIIQRCSACVSVKVFDVNGTEHPHNYVDKGLYAATCMQAEITAWFSCLDCAEEIIEYGQAALGHDFEEGYYPEGDSHYQLCQRENCGKVYSGHVCNEWSLLQEGNCTQADIEEGVCTLCEASLTRTTEPRHDWDNGDITLEPTCTQEGIKIYHCANCENSKTETLAIQHSWDSGTITTQPTCTQTGVKTFDCTKCDETRTETIASLKHEMVYHYNEWSHWGECSRVGCEYTMEEKHSIKEMYGVLLEEDDGEQKTYVYALFHECTICDYQKQVGEPSIEHMHYVVETIEGKLPTCLEDGYSAELRCGVEGCGEVLVASKVLTAGHSWNNGEITLEPTCTETGVKTFTCTVCKVKDYTEDVPALGHDITTHTAKGPTCTEIGWNIYETCEREGCNYTTYEEIPATGVHVWDSGVVTVEPTCTEEGEKLFTCTLCGEATKVEIVPALDHDRKIHTAQDATCTEIGWRAHETCEREGCDYTTYEEIPATGVHVWDSGVVTVMPTCTVAGEKLFTCTLCGEATKTETVPATGEHTWDEGIVSKEPNCTETGERILTCSVCKTATVTETIPVKHNYVNDRCSICGETSLEYFKFTLLEDDTYSVSPKNKNNLPSEIVIPATYNEKNVSTIATSAFYQCTNLTKVTTGRGITTIKATAFGGCTKLKSVVISDSVTNIEIAAFFNCTSLTSVVIGKGLTSLGEQMFASCTALKSFTIPSNIKTVEGLAFSGCTGLTSFVIPDSVTAITGAVFNKCKNLTEITVPFLGLDRNDTTVKARVDHLFDIKMFDYGINSSQFIPASLKKITVTGGCLAPSAFANCSNLTSVVLSGDITSIPNFAFSGCSNLTNLVIPNNIGHVGKDAFANCGNLTFNEFGNCKYLENSENPYYALISFKSDANGTYAIHEDAKVIADNAFYNCSAMTEIVIPEGVMSIGAYTFYGCIGLRSVTIPDGIKSVGEYAFYNCSELQSVIIPEGVISIGQYAFYHCSGLQNVTIFDSVASIGDYAFAYCDSLANVIMGNGLTMIGSDAFRECSSLIGVYITDIEAWCEILFNGIYANPLSYAKNLYLNEELVAEVAIIGETTEIKQYAFYNCKNLKSLIIGNSVTTIGASAFFGCSELTSIEIGDNVTEIGYGPFLGCDNVTKVTGPISIFSSIYLTKAESIVITSGEVIDYRTFEDYKNLTSVGIGDRVTSFSGEAFYRCYKLAEIIVSNGNPVYKSIDGTLYNKDGTALIFYGKGKTATEFDIPEAVTTIGDYAFYGSANLTGIEIGSNVNEIGYYAFFGCSGLASLEIQEGVTHIKDDAFTSCGSLISVIIPDSVTYLGSAFKQCSSLTKVVIGNGVRKVNGFNECHNLMSVVIGSSVTNIENYAFQNCYKLVEVVNKSTYITVTKGSESNGYVGIYAIAVYNSGDPFTSRLTNDNGYIIYNMPGTAGIKILMGYSGAETALILPTYVTKIHQYALSYFSNLTSVVIPDSVTEIGASAFIGCKSLANLVIPEGVTVIGSRAFQGCTSLTSVVIPNRVNRIGFCAFTDCSNLANVTFKDTSTWYRTNSFSNWENQTNGTKISLTTSTSTNAAYIKSTYTGYYWYKL